MQYPSADGVPRYPPVTSGHWIPIAGSFHARPPRRSMPEVIDFVTELCLVGQNQKAMRKAFRNQELFFVFFRQFHTIPFSIGCGTFPQIHRHIKYAAAHSAHEFALRIVDLKMQSAQYTLDGHRLVILYKLDIESGFFLFPSLFFLEKIPGTPVYGLSSGSNPWCNHTQPFDTADIFFPLLSVPLFFPLSC